MSETRQLFNSMDPAPFSKRDLDPAAAAYIVDWGREASTTQALMMVVYLSSESATDEDAILLRNSVHEYFNRRAFAARRQLRQLFRDGRISLFIGVVFLALAIVIGEFIAGLIVRESYARLVEESLGIGGWVALWRPLGIFLYDWWPIRSEAKLFERLGKMDVRVFGANDTDLYAPVLPKP